MKYIKTYENYFNFEKNVEVGDYVKLFEMSFYDRSVDPPVFVEIEDKGKIIDKIPKKGKETFQYFIEMIESSSWYNKYSIERKMTPEEIKDFEFKKTVSKFNL